MYNNMPTPFFGLSLMIHAGIIGAAKAVKLGRRLLGLSTLATTAAAAHVVVPVGATRRQYNYMLSVMFIAIIAVFMLVSAFLALRTSVREGSDEWHREFLKAEFAPSNQYQIMPSQNFYTAYNSATDTVQVDIPQETENNGALFSVENGGLAPLKIGLH